MSAGRRLSNVLGSYDRASGYLSRAMRSRPVVRTTAISLTIASAIALTMMPVRESVGTANIALALGIVVVLAGSIAGRGPGLVTAVWASALFALLHSVPHGLPRVEDEQDLATALLLLVAGGLAGWFHRRAAVLEERARETRQELRLLHLVGEAAASSQDASEVVKIIADAVSAELHLADCFWEEGAGVGSWRELHHSGLVEGLGFDADPGAIGEAMTDGVAIDFGLAGRLVLIGREGARPSLRALKVGIVLADYGVALLKPHG